MLKYFVYSKLLFREAMEKDGFITPEPLVFDGQRRTLKQHNAAAWSYQGAPESFGGNSLLFVGSYGFNHKIKQHQFCIELPI